MSCLRLLRSAYRSNTRKFPSRTIPIVAIPISQPRLEEIKLNASSAVGVGVSERLREQAHTRTRTLTLTCTRLVAVYSYVTFDAERTSERASERRPSVRLKAQRLTQQAATVTAGAARRSLTLSERHPPPAHAYRHTHTVESAPSQAGRQAVSMRKRDS